MKTTTLTDLLEKGYRIIVMCAYNPKILEEGWRLTGNNSRTQIKRNDLALVCNIDTTESRAAATAAKTTLQNQNTHIVQGMEFDSVVSDGRMVDEVLEYFTPIREQLCRARTILMVVDPERVKPLAQMISSVAKHPDSGKIPRLSIKPCGAIAIGKTGIYYTDAPRD